MLRILRVELPVHHARGVSPLVVQQDFQAVLAGQLHGQPVELEILLAEVDDALIGRLAPRGLQVVRGEARGGPAAGLQVEAAEVLLHHVLDTASDVFFG